MTEAAAPRRPRRWLIALPLVVFAGLAVLMFWRLGAGDPSRVPSALIGRPAPSFTLPPIEGLGVPGFSRADLEGRVSVVNVWASWCVPCRAEHPLLAELAADERIALFGLNYKDAPADARRFLGQLGNPFAAVGADGQGRTAIDWGVYGVPETFIVDRRGDIVHKQIGPLDPAILRAEFLPALERALEAR